MIHQADQTCATPPFSCTPIGLLPLDWGILSLHSPSPRLHDSGGKSLCRHAMEGTESSNEPSGSLNVTAHVEGTPGGREGRTIPFGRSTKPPPCQPGGAEERAAREGEVSACQRGEAAGRGTGVSSRRWDSLPNEAHDDSPERWALHRNQSPPSLSTARAAGSSEYHLRHERHLPQRAPQGLAAPLPAGTS